MRDYSIVAEVSIPIGYLVDICHSRDHDTSEGFPFPLGISSTFVAVRLPFFQQKLFPFPLGISSTYFKNLAMEFWKIVSIPIGYLVDYEEVNYRSATLRVSIPIGYLSDEV